MQYQLALQMNDTFEAKKNTKAAAITAGIAGALLLILFIVTFPMAQVPPPVEELGIEVNLGTGDVGSGTDQPHLPGEPAPSEQTAYNPPKAISSPVQDIKAVETDDRDETAPEIVNPPTSKPNATQINEAAKQPKAVKTASTEPPRPAPAQPKAVLGRTTGGNGNGGNGAAIYKPGTGEGVAGGAGDQGRPGGTEGATNYEGGGKGNGSAITRGLTGRSIVGGQSFTDEFNQNGTVAMDVVVDASGKVTSATYQPRGTNTNNSTLIAIARRRAFQLKFSAGDREQRGTVEFSFKVRN